MPKFKLVSDKNLIKIVRKYMGKVPVSERELLIFEKNIIPGFFRPQLSGKHKMEYIAPMSKPLAQYMKQNLTVHKLYSIIAQTIETVKKIERYGLYLNNLLLDERLIYVKELSGELLFLYEPVLNRDSSTNVYAFLADLLAEIETKDTSVQVENRKLKAFFKDPQNYRIEDIEMFILLAYPQIYQQITRIDNKNRGKSGCIASSQLSYLNHNKVNNQNDQNDVNDTTSLDEVEGTILLDSEDGTVLLTDTQPIARICRRSDGETYYIRACEFHIGKSSDAECYIQDNHAISRKHAFILHRECDYFIVDDGSTNHTYVNGQMLEPGTETLLHHEDVIRFGDEEFDFYEE